MIVKWKEEDLIDKLLGHVTGDIKPAPLGLQGLGKQNIVNHIDAPSMITTFV